MNNINSDGTYTWNPWVGCKKCGAGCKYCKALHTIRLQNSELNRPVQAEYLPGVQASDKPFKIPSGSVIRVCTTSDFFIDGLDKSKHDAIEKMNKRKDCLFIINTRRPENIDKYFASYDEKEIRNIVINVAIENNETAWERVPILLNTNSMIKYRGIVVKPMLESIDLSPFLSSGLIDGVEVSGESYKGWDGVARELHLDWVKYLSEQCKEYDVSFEFKATGSRIYANDKMAYVRQLKDEINLAKFYKLDYESTSCYNIWHLADVLQDLDLEERASRLMRLFGEKYGMSPDIDI